MSVRNRTAPGRDRIRPEHLPPVLINTLARLFTRYLLECKVPKQWKTSKTVLLYKKGDPHDIGNYRPICLLSVIYKLFTRVILNRIEKVLDEGQPCEQAGFRKGFSTIDHIHTVSKLIEVSREYKMPLCLTFIDLKKAFDSVETEAVVEALDNQGVPTQYIKVLRELYSNFTTGISPFYKNIIIDVKRGVRQGDTISPKIFTATLENAMRKLEWDDMGVKVDGRQLHHLRFADDIVLVTPSISQAERMLTEFDETCGCIGLQLNLQKTMFMRNGWVSDAPFTLNGTNISECTSYVYLGRELNMMNDLTPELGRRRRAAWGAYKSIEDVVKKTRNTRLRAHLFNTTVLPALTYASETWAFRKQEENASCIVFGEGAGANILCRFAMENPNRILGTILVHCTSTTAGIVEYCKDKVINMRLENDIMTDGAWEYLVTHKFGTANKKERQMFVDQLKKTLNPRNLSKYLLSFTKRTDLSGSIGSKLDNVDTLLVSGSKASHLHTVYTTQKSMNRRKTTLLVVDNVADVLQEAPDNMARSFILLCKGCGVLSGVAIPGMERQRTLSSSMEEADRPRRLSVTQPNLPPVPSN
ncbi:hypothetical protein RB195_025418 [Necator americanus]|uniref:Reverse transcriptase domain-containing protein n=1 Tax=Necator americanus TaxID=51031 RepID=A0ABR1ES80_NECAM